MKKHQDFSRKKAKNKARIFFGALVDGSGMGTGDGLAAVHTVSLIGTKCFASIVSMFSIADRNG